MLYNTLFEYNMLQIMEILRSIGEQILFSVLQ